MLDNYLSSITSLPKLCRPLLCRHWNAKIKKGRECRRSSERTREEGECRRWNAETKRGSVEGIVREREREEEE